LLRQGFRRFLRKRPTRRIGSGCHFWGRFTPRSVRFCSIPHSPFGSLQDGLHRRTSSRAEDRFPNSRSFQGTPEDRRRVIDVASWLASVCPAKGRERYRTHPRRSHNLPVSKQCRKRETPSATEIRMLSGVTITQFAQRITAHMLA
jgi:hypothetical protein